MKELLKFYRFLGKYKVKMIVFLPVVVVSVVLDTISPFWLKKIIDGAMVGNQTEILIYLSLFGISIVGESLISALSFALGDRVMIRLMRDIRATVFHKVMDLDFAYHVEKNTGSLISAFRRGEGAVFNVFFSIHQELFRVLISLIVTLVFLARVSIPMAGSLLVLFVVNLVVVIVLIQANLKHRKQFNKSEDEVAGLISDTMINYETVKFFASEVRERERLNEISKSWTANFWKYANTFRMMDISIGTISGLGILFILYLAVSRLGKDLGVSDLVMVAGFITAFHGKFFGLFFRIRDIAKSSADLEKYLGILDNEIKVKDPIKESRRQVKSGKIEFRNIGFIYPKNQEKIIQDVNITVDDGQRVALVGRSGAGKTTLVKLLLRFYDPSFGMIKIGGVDIKKLKKSTLRSMISVVPQEPIMFNNTIKFNLAYGRPTASEEEIRLAATRASILDFIESLPEKWETQVGERGIKLSGGQKQRLAIARCFLADPKIIIFDEATSNLDSESEKKIQSALEEISKDRTMIIIAHRFSTIRGADKIVVLSNGTVIESGKHQELIAKGGLYKMLWTLQAKGKLTAEDGIGGRGSAPDFNKK